MIAAACRNGLVLAAVGILAGCAAGPAAKTGVTGQATPAPAAEPLDESYDWHGLMVLPFGTLLKSSPIALHEVLLFHDDSHANSPEVGKDCYTVDGKPPRLVDHESEGFLLCFSHDRLDRIEASVTLKAAEGPAVLARACALWLKSPEPAAARDICEGHDGEVAFSAHLTGLPGDASGSAATAAAADFQVQPSILSLVLTQGADGGSPVAAPGH